MAMAIGNIHSGIIAGKLNGVMPAHTPSGCSRVKVSTPPATLLANSPSCRLPIPAACSTTSRPRNTSPSASGRVLPCSAVRIAASSFMCSRISCWYLRKIRERAPIGVFFQVRNAVLALAMARCTSSSVAKGTRASTCWVAGLITSRHCVEVDSTALPSMNSLTVGTAVVGAVIGSPSLRRFVVMSLGARPPRRTGLILAVHF
ncbi:MAG: hypothetical protein GAK45_01095 [Pseudomonas citronellolis]|nr:MAG: hypothetical protein GAK45_01095 [Pseudomonas citronellolis]